MCHTNLLRVWHILSDTCVWCVYVSHKPTESVTYFVWYMCLMCVCVTQTYWECDIFCLIHVFDVCLCHTNLLRVWHILSDVCLCHTNLLRVWHILSDTCSYSVWCVSVIGEGDCSKDEELLADTSKWLGRELQITKVRFSVMVTIVLC